MAFSITERAGSLTSLFTVKGGLRADIGMITSGYSSLGAVNSDLDDYAFAEVGITTDLRYYRNQAANAWILYFSSSNFSTGNLSPLFTASIVNPTTAPTLTFALSTQTQGTVFGNATAGNPGPPSFTSTPALGVANTTEGSLTLYSATSGSALVRLIGGSGNFNFNLPLSAGTLGQALVSGGGGSTAMSWATITSGTVTSFSAGNLSPLFTTSVATATTTPALSFTISNAGAGTLFGNNAGSANPPAFTVSPTLGVANTTEGSLTFYSATSGSTVIRLIGGSGNYNFNLPLSAGTTGQVLTSAGGTTAAMTWSTVLTAITADNGLTASTATNVQLGGTLLQLTTIATGNFRLSLTTSTAGAQPFYVQATTGAAASFNNTSTGQTTVSIANGDAGNGLSVTAQGGDAIVAQTTANGNGAEISAINGFAGIFYVIPSSTNTVVPVVKLGRSTSGTNADGIGGSIDFYVEAGGLLNLSHQLISKWTVVNSSTRTSEFSITGVNSAVTSTILTLAGTGALRLNKYGVGSFTGTAAYALQVDASGNIIEGTPATGGDIAGVYTPTLTGAANVTNSTAYECQYLAVTDGTTGVQVVTVSGKFAITFTTGGAVTRLGISIPIVSALSADQNVGGVAASNSLTNGSFAVRADTTNNRAEFYATAPGSGTSETYWFTFTYVVNPP